MTIEQKISVVIQILKKTNAVVCTKLVQFRAIISPNTNIILYIKNVLNVLNEYSSEQLLVQTQLLYYT